MTTYRRIQKLVTAAGLGYRAAKDNTVWYDDVVLSTGYVGPVRN